MDESTVELPQTGDMEERIDENFDDTTSPSENIRLDTTCCS